MTRHEKFSQRMAMLCETFERDATESLLETYWFALNDLSEERLDRGVFRCLRESRFMPRPADIRHAAGEVENPAVLADVAWREVRSLISEWHRSLTDPLAELVVSSLGGWSTLEDRTEDENSTWTRKEFLRLYEEYARNPRAMESLERRELPKPTQPGSPISVGFKSIEEVLDSLDTQNEVT
jgi:hypothetical protein